MAASSTATDPVRRHDLGLLESAQPGVMATAPPAGSRGRESRRSHPGSGGASLSSWSSRCHRAVLSSRSAQQIRRDAMRRRHDSRRSARARPPGSGQRAGATQGSGVRARRVAASTTWTASWASICQAAWTATGLAPARVRTQQPTCGCQLFESPHGTCVLMDQPTEPISSCDPPRRRQDSWLAGLKRRLAQGAVRAAAVVMANVRGQYRLQLPASQDQHPVQHLPPDGAHPAMGVGICPRRGARTGVCSTSIASAAKTASNAAVNLVSRSRTRNRNRPCGRQGP
jgi:hypothetical protein